MTLAARFRAPGWYRVLIALPLAFAFSIALVAAVRAAYGWDPIVQWNAVATVALCAAGALQVVGGLLGARYGEGVGQAAMQGGSIAAQGLFLLPGSRAQETEADVVGQELMARAGFDPRKAVDLWQNMIAAGGSRPPQWLSTHPDPSSRISELQARAEKLVPTWQQARAAGRRPACG